MLRHCAHRCQKIQSIVARLAEEQRGSCFLAWSRDYTPCLREAHSLTEVPDVRSLKRQKRNRIAKPGNQDLLQTITLEDNRQLQYQIEGIAPLADGACLVTFGRSQLLATVAIADSQQYVPRRNFVRLPLQVEHRERMAAVGRVPAGYQRREGGTDREKQVACMVRQAIAPLFPPGFSRAVAVTTTLLSSDGQADQTALAINAVSVALRRSGLPLTGFVAAVKHSANLNASTVASNASLELLFAGTDRGPVLLSMQGSQVSEEQVINACRKANSEIKLVLKGQEPICALAMGSITPANLPPSVDPAAMRNLADVGRPLVMKALQGSNDTAYTIQARLWAAMEQCQLALRENGYFRTPAMRVPGSGCVSSRDLDLGWGPLVAQCIEHMVSIQNERVDGRGLLDCRDCHSIPHPLQTPHGSAMLTMGNTQVLSSITVSTIRPADASHANAKLAVRQDSLNMPAGQEDFQGSRSTQNLVTNFIEAALRPVLSDEASFPYGVRINSEASSLDGGLAETSVSSACLALYDAGVPLRAPIAGMGVGILGKSPWGLNAEDQIAEDRSKAKYEVILDPQGLEEFACPAVLRTAGTDHGLTALYLEASVPGIPLPYFEEGLLKVKAARLRALSHIRSKVEQVQDTTSPVFGQTDIAKEYIGKLIGPGGITLRGIEERTGAKIHVSDEGRVYFYAPSDMQYKQCNDAISELSGHNIKEGHRYLVKVKRIEDYGAFVQLPNGYQALLHISELAKQKVQRVGDELQVGDEVEVICLGRDGHGHVKISRKAIL